MGLMRNRRLEEEYSDILNGLGIELDNDIDLQEEIIEQKDDQDKNEEAK